MNKKYNNKLIIGLAVPICLSIASVDFNNSKLNLDNKVVYAQDQQSTGFKVYEPEIGSSGQLEIAVEGQDTSDTLFKRYWNKIDKLLIDGKNFVFNSQNTNGKFYKLYDGKLTFYTDHFSTYTIVSRAKEAKNNSDSSQSIVEQRFNNILPKTGLTENSTGAVLY